MLSSEGNAGMDCKIPGGVSVATWAGASGAGVTSVVGNGEEGVMTSAAGASAVGLGELADVPGATWTLAGPGAERPGETLK